MVVVYTNTSGCSTHIITNQGFHVTYISSPKSHIWATSPPCNKLHLLTRIRQKISLLEFECKTLFQSELDACPNSNSSRIKTFTRRELQNKRLMTCRCRPHSSYHLHCSILTPLIGIHTSYGVTRNSIPIKRKAQKGAR